MPDRISLAGAFKHSKFVGGKEIAAKSPPVEDINELISRISHETQVPPETVHKIIAMAQPSTIAYVMKQLHGVPEIKTILANRVITMPDVAV